MLKSSGELSACPVKYTRGGSVRMTSRRRSSATAARKRDRSRGDSKAPATGGDVGAAAQRGADTAAAALGYIRRWTRDVKRQEAELALGGRLERAALAERTAAIAARTERRLAQGVAVAWGTACTDPPRSTGRERCAAAPPQPPALRRDVATANRCEWKGEGLLRRGRCEPAAGSVDEAARAVELALAAEPPAALPDIPYEAHVADIVRALQRDPRTARAWRQVTLPARVDAPVDRRALLFLMMYEVRRVLSEGQTALPGVWAEDPQFVSDYIYTTVITTLAPVSKRAEWVRQAVAFFAQPRVAAAAAAARASASPSTRPPPAASSLSTAARVATLLLGTTLLPSAAAAAAGGPAATGAVASTAAGGGGGQVVAYGLPLGGDLATGLIFGTTRGDVVESARSLPREARVEWLRTNNARSLTRFRLLRQWVRHTISDGNAVVTVHLPSYSDTTGNDVFACATVPTLKALDFLEYRALLTQAQVYADIGEDVPPELLQEIDHIAFEHDLRRGSTGEELLDASYPVTDAMLKNLWSDLLDIYNNAKYAGGPLVASSHVADGWMFKGVSKITEKFALPQIAQAAQNIKPLVSLHLSAQYVNDVLKAAQAATSASASQTPEQAQAQVTKLLVATMAKDRKEMPPNSDSAKKLLKLILDDNNADTGAADRNELIIHAGDAIYEFQAALTDDKAAELATVLIGLLTQTVQLNATLIEARANAIFVGKAKVLDDLGAAAADNVRQVVNGALGLALVAVVLGVMRWRSGAAAPAATTAAAPATTTPTGADTGASASERMKGLTTFPTAPTAVNVNVAWSPSLSPPPRLPPERPRQPPRNVNLMFTEMINGMSAAGVRLLARALGVKGGTKRLENENALLTYSHRVADPAEFAQRVQKALGDETIASGAYGETRTPVWASRQNDTPAWLQKFEPTRYQ